MTDERHGAAPEAQEGEFGVHDASEPGAQHLNSARFFANRDCEYFPCHEGVDEGEFNCLLCYCPLYALGPDCGGNFSYTKRGRKTCVNCNLPHRGESGVDHVMAHYEQLARLAGERPKAL